MRTIVLTPAEVAQARSGTRRAHLTPRDPGARPWCIGEPAIIRAPAERRQLGRRAPEAPDEHGRFSAERRLLAPEPVRVIITDARLVRLGDLTDQDARRILGPRQRAADLAAWWMATYDAAWMADARTRRAHSLVLTTRWDREWADTGAVLIAWEHDTRDRPRLLGRDGGPSYVASGARALAGCGEAVPEEYQQIITVDVQDDIRQRVAVAAGQSRRKYEERRPWAHEESRK